MITPYRVHQILTVGIIHMLQKLGLPVHKDVHDEIVSHFQKIKRNSHLGGMSSAFCSGALHLVPLQK